MLFDFGARTLVDPANIDLVAANHFSPGASFFFGVLVLLCGGGALVALLFVRARALTLRTVSETRAAESPSDLEPGPHKMVRGVVEPTENEAIAVRVEIDQIAKNHTAKNNSWHTWEETGRRTMARPFYLVTDQGETVLVEPGEDAFVIDEMETTFAGCPTMGRKRYCDVERGETFSAYGTLVRQPHARAASAYRDGMGLVLKRPANGRMYLASASIKDRYTQRIAHMRKWGIVSALVFVAFQAIFVAPYLATALFGTRDLARVVHHRSWVTHNKNSTTTHYAVSVYTESGVSFEREVTSPAYADLGLLERTGEKVPTVHLGDSDYAAYLGDRPTLNGIAVILGLCSGVGALIGFFATYRAKKAWYDRDKVSDHGGTGHYYGVK